MPVNQHTESKPSKTRVEIICWAYLLVVIVLLVIFAFAVLRYVVPLLPPEIPRSINPREDSLGALMILVASVLTIFVPAGILMQFIGLAALKPFFARAEVIYALTREPRPLFRGKLARWMLNLVWPQKVSSP